MAIHRSRESPSLRQHADRTACCSFRGTSRGVRTLVQVHDPAAMPAEEIKRIRPVARRAG